MSGSYAKSKKCPAAMQSAGKGRESRVLWGLPVLPAAGNQAGAAGTVK